MVRDGVCEHVRFDAGRCPQRPGEVAVSTLDAVRHRWRPGRVLSFVGLINGTDAEVAAAPSVPLTVVGSYTSVPDPAYWGARRIDGTGWVPREVGFQRDPWLTTAGTLRPAWRRGVTMEYPVDPERTNADTLGPAAAVLAGLRDPAGDIAYMSPLQDIAAAAAAGRDQLRVVLPVVMAQPLLLCLAVLVLVVSAAAAQRRAEAGLAVLRGGGRRSARRLVGGELGAVLLAGVPLGILLALGVALLVRAVALPAGVPFDPGWPPIVAALAAALVTVAVVWIVVRRATADPVLTMLRRGALATARRGVGTLTWIVLALAGAGVVALVSGDRPTPVSLATPTLLALAAGLLVAGLGAVGGRRAAARALAAGHVPRRWRRPVWPDGRARGSSWSS